VKPHLRSLIRLLRRDAPPLLPIRVYVRDKVGDGWLGATTVKYDERDRPKHFMVEIRKSVGAVMRDTVLHEWAHAVAWREGHETVCDHDPEWALAYSRPAGQNPSRFSSARSAWLTRSWMVLGSVLLIWHSNTARRAR
jgi:hypothetical protein